MTQRYYYQWISSEETGRFFSYGWQLFDRGGPSLQGGGLIPFARVSTRSNAKKIVDALNTVDQTSKPSPSIPGRGGGNTKPEVAVVEYKESGQEILHNRLWRGGVIKPLKFLKD